MKKRIILIFLILLLPLGACTEKSDPDAPDSTEVMNLKRSDYKNKI